MSATISKSVTCVVHCCGFENFPLQCRIVLERPEYGFATYFFELVQSLPVRWQVKRLVTVMSVASTGRAALLENRQLEVSAT